MTDLTTVTQAPTENQAEIPLLGPAAVKGVSAPLAQNPGLVGQILELNKQIFSNFYNVFRLIGYLAENFYSEARTRIEQIKPEWKEPKDFGDPRLLRPDYKSKPRLIVNIAEAVLFETGAVIAFFRDRKHFRRDISAVIAAETGEENSKLSARDILKSDNPLIQSAANRLKALYSLRFVQPLTFLWGLKLGVASTVLEIIAERTAYFETNSYDRLERLNKEIDSNQYGSWSQTSLVDQMITLVQQNRLEHNSSPIASADIQNYIPLFRNLADRMIDKKWRIAEMVYVLGQIIKEPAAIAKAQQAFEDVEAHTLHGIAQMKLSGRKSLINDNAVDHITEEHSSQAAFVKDIVERGPKTPAHLTQATKANEAVSSLQIAG